MIRVKCEQIQILPGGTILPEFDDKTSREFSSIEHARETVATILDAEFAKQALVAMAIASGNPRAFAGAAIAIDWTSLTPITVTLAEVTDG